MISQLNHASAQVIARPLAYPVAQQSSTVPRLRSRSAPQPALLHRTSHAAQQEKLLSLPLVRGLGGSDLTLAPLRAMAAGRTVHLPLFWGFRALDPGQSGLHAAEVNTLRAYIDMVRSLGKHCQPVLLLADAHAAHNGIPSTIWAPYYAAVARQADGMNLRTVMLSSVMATLGMTAQTLGAHGRTLVLRPREARTAGATLLSPEDWSQLKLQSRHLCERFPQVFAKPVGEKAKRALYEPRALAYVQLRAAEGRHLLPALKGCFDGQPVLPVHLSDPGTERLGVHGLHIYAMDADNVRQVAIPWK